MWEKAGLDEGGSAGLQEGERGRQGRSNGGPSSCLPVPCSLCARRRVTCSEVDVAPERPVRVEPMVVHGDIGPRDVGHNNTDLGRGEGR